MNTLPSDASDVAHKQNTVNALLAEVSRLEGLRDLAVAQATNDEQRELVRCALQKDVDLGRAPTCPG